MKKTLFQTTLVVLFLISCSYEDEKRALQLNKDDNDFLIINSISEFEHLTDKLTEMTESELDQWERTQSFKSYRSILNEAANKWEKIEDKDGEDAFLKEYGDILTIIDSALVPNIPIKLYQAIVNRQGFYETDGFIHKVIGDHVVSVPRHEYPKIQNFSSIEELKNIKDDKMNVVRYLDANTYLSGRVNATCGAQMTASYYYNPSNCRNDRKVHISARSYIKVSRNYEGDWRQPRVEIKVWGELRTGTFCNWKTYTTTFSYRNVSFSINGYSVQNNTPLITKYDLALADYAPTDERSNLTWDQPIGDPVLNQLIVPFQFIELHAEGASRGTNSNWAILDCR